MTPSPDMLPPDFFNRKQPTPDTLPPDFFNGKPKSLDPNYVAPTPTMLTDPKTTISNSLGNTLEGFGHAAMHPIDTATNLLKVGAGTIQNMSLVQTPGPPSENQEMANAVGRYFKGRALHPLDTLNTDPVGAISDIAAVADPLAVGLRGGAKLAEVANAGRLASGLRTGADAAKAVATYTNPLAPVAKVAGYAAGKTIGALTNVRSGLSPLESAAVDYALQDPALQGTVDAATATGNKALAAQKSLLRKFPTSAGVVGDAEIAQQGAIRGKMGDLAQGVAPGGPQHIFTSGQQTLEAIKKTLNGYSSQASDAFENRLYGAAEANPVDVQTGTRPLRWDEMTPEDQFRVASGESALAPPVPVIESIAGPTDMKAVKATAKPMLDQLKKQMGIAVSKTSPILSMVEDIVNGPDVVSLRTAKSNISAIQDFARNEAGVMRKPAQALSAQLVSPFHDAIDSAAQGVGPDAYQALQDGNAATRAKYDLAKAIPGSYLKRDVPPNNLAQLHDLLTKNEDAQFPALQKVVAHVPAAAPGIARATIEDIFRGVTEGGGISKVQTAINKWNDLGPQTKQLLFGADTTQEVDNLLQYAKMAVSESNPSGTAPTAQVMALFAMMAHNPMAGITAMAGARQLAKGIFSPETASTIRQTGRVPLPGPGRIAKAATAPVSNPAYLNVGRANNNATGNDPLGISPFMGQQ